MPDAITSIGCRYTQTKIALADTPGSEDPRTGPCRGSYQQYRLFPRRTEEVGPHHPAPWSPETRRSPPSGISGGSSPLFADNGAPSISDHTVANCTHSTGRFVSGGQASAGCASSKNRSRVEPDRPLHKTKTGGPGARDAREPLDGTVIAWSAMGIPFRRQRPPSRPRLEARATGKLRSGPAGRQRRYGLSRSQRDGITRVAAPIRSAAARTCQRKTRHRGPWRDGRAAVPQRIADGEHTAARWCHRGNLIRPVQPTKGKCS